MAREIRIRRKAQKSLSRIPEPHRSKIIAAIRRLPHDPHPSGSKKLTGREAWRIRIGRYRTIYEILENDLVILVLDIAHRKDIYRK